jgi:hypothetical protein
MTDTAPPEIDLLWDFEHPADSVTDPNRRT